MKQLLAFVTIFAFFNAHAEVVKPSSQWTDRDVFDYQMDGKNFDVTYGDRNAIIQLLRQDDSALKDPTCARNNIAAILKDQSVTKIQAVESINGYCDIPLVVGSWKVLKKAEFFKVEGVDVKGQASSRWFRCEANNSEWKISHYSCGSIFGFDNESFFDRE
jgi:hypothetical protein